LSLIRRHRLSSGLSKLMARTKPSETSLAYLAGLFDGEGYIGIRTRKKQSKKDGPTYQCWDVRAEISMTHEETIRYIQNLLGFGSFNHRLPIKSWVGKQPQWRMRFANHDTWLLAKWLHPYALTKKLEWEKVLNHYDYAA
jgi:intein/homing endonuclease